MMRNIPVLALLLITAPATVCAQAAPPASVTLFTSGQVLVRRTLPIAIPAGVSTQSLALGDFDPASFGMLDDGIALVRLVNGGALNEDALLRRNVGQLFQIAVSDKEFRQARLLSMDPERWQWIDGGGVVFGRPGRVVWPATTVPAAPLTDVTVRADHARRSLAVMYQADGGSWTASYHLFLGLRPRLDGAALINTGPVALDDAEVQLLAGNIGVRSSPQPMYRMQAAPAATGFAARDEVTTQETYGSEPVGESHLYTLPGRVSLAPAMSELVPLFDPAPVRPVREYSMTGAIPYYGGFQQEQRTAMVPVDVSYRIDRALGTPFGDLPLPAGAVSVFQPDRAGRMQLIGAGSIAHVAGGDTMRVQVGTAFDVTARRVETDYHTTQERAHTTAYMTIAVTLQNAKDSAVVVDVNEDRSGDWSVVSSTIPAHRKSSTLTTFAVPVPARDTASLTYSVRVVW